MEPMEQITLRHFPDAHDINAYHHKKLNFIIFLQRNVY